MKEICIQFAEWVGTNTFNGRFMMHETSSIGVHKWRMFNESNFLTTDKLYQKFCDSKKFDFTVEQKLLYLNGELEPVNFVEYITKRNLWFYRWTFKGVLKKSYWTKNNKKKFDTNQLWNDFILQK